MIKDAKSFLRLALSQDLENEGLKLAIAAFWGVLFFKGDHNILRLKH